MRRFSAALLTASLLAPMGAAAAFTLPSDVLRAVQRDSSPHQFSVEVHGSAEGAYMSMWAKGKYQGSSILDAKSTGKVTVDFAQPSMGVTARFKVQYIVTDATAYVLIDDMSFTGENPAARLQGSLQSKRWIRVSAAEILDESDLSTFAMPSPGMEEANAMFGAIADAIFSLSQRRIAADTEYTMEMKEDAFEGLVRVIASQSGADTADRDAMRDMMRSMRADPFMAQLRKIMSGLQMSYVIRMSPSETMSRSVFSGSLSTEEGINVRFTGESSALGAPVSATPPAASVDPEEFFSDMDSFGSGLFDPSPFGMPPPMMSPSWDTEDEWDTWEEDGDTDGMEDWSWTEDGTTGSPCAAVDAASVYALRKGGTCDARAMRPSRR